MVIGMTDKVIDMSTGIIIRKLMNYLQISYQTYMLMF